MTIDINAVRQRHLRPEQMEHRTFYEGHIAIDLANLCDEVEHLRGERAAVVAYLRAPGTSCDNEVLAEAVERGEHRRGEKE
jgi:hypothetical protein